MSIRDLEQWIDNDEGLYRWWLGSRMSKRAFIRANREELERVIDGYLAVKPRESSIEKGAWR